MPRAPLPCLNQIRLLATPIRVALVAAVFAAVAPARGPLLAADPVVRVDYRVQLDEHSPLAYGPMQLASPVLAGNGFVLCATAGGSLHLLTTADGETVYSSKLDGGVSATPLLVEDRVFVGTEEGSVHLLSLCDGTPLWEKPARVKGAVRSTPVLWDDALLFVQDDRSVLLALDAATGEVAYEYTEQSFAERGLSPFTVFGYPSPSVSGDALFAAFETGKVARFKVSRPGGEGSPGLVPDWTSGLCDYGRKPTDPGKPEIRVCSSRRFFTDADSSPTLTSEGLVTGCHCRGLFMLDPETGKTRWETPLRGPSAPLIVRDTVFAVTADGGAHALKLDSGEVRWSTRLDISLVSRPVLVGLEQDLSGGLLAIASGGDLFLLDAGSGKLIGRLTTLSGFSATPAVDGHTLFLISNEGFLYRVEHFR